jgi:hypothetical protein
MVTLQKLPKWVWIFAIIVCFPSMLLADEFFTKDRSVGLVRHDARCEHSKILAHLVAMGAGQLLEHFKKATLTYGGRDWESCWIELDGFVMSVDEEGVPLEPIPSNRFGKGSV